MLAPQIEFLVCIILVSYRNMFFFFYCLLLNMNYWACRVRRFTGWNFENNRDCLLTISTSHLCIASIHHSAVSSLGSVCIVLYSTEQSEESHLYYCDAHSLLRRRAGPSTCGFGSLAAESFRAVALASFHHFTAIVGRPCMLHQARCLLPVPASAFIL